MDGWLDPVYDAQGMRAADSWAIDEQGVPSLDLMETAGEAVAEAVRDASRGRPGSSGLREGQQRRRRARRGATSGRHRLRGRGAAALARRRALAGRRGEPRALRGRGPRGGGGGTACCPGGSGAVIDASSAPASRARRAHPPTPRSRRSTACSAPVIAADIASGVSASSGEAEGAAVKADITVSFHAAKVGHWIAPGKPQTGELRVAAIGIPDGAPSEPAGGVIRDEVLGSPPNAGRTRPSSTPARCS